MSSSLYDERSLYSNGPYRYRFGRRWQIGGRTALFVMLNPSTADDFHDDPTTRSCRRIATAQGYGALEIVNLYALRATDPRELVARSAKEDPIGAENNAAIAAAADLADIVIVAWGVIPNGLRKLQRPPHIRFRARAVIAALAPRALFCLGYTLHGRFPRHPLYLPANVGLVPFEH